MLVLLLGVGVKGKRSPVLEFLAVQQQQVLGPAQVELQVSRLLQTAGQEEQQLLHIHIWERATHQGD